MIDDATIGILTGIVSSIAAGIASYKKTMSSSKANTDKIEQSVEQTNKHHNEQLLELSFKVAALENDSRGTKLIIEDMRKELSLLNSNIARILAILEERSK